MKTSLRALGTGDVGRYRALRLRGLLEEPRAFSDAFEDERDSHADHAALAMGDSREHFTVGAFAENDALVGVATFKRDPRRKARHKSTIHTMYVASEARGRGVARALLDFVIEHAQAANVEQIHLWVLDPLHSAARRLYLRAGFTSQGAIVRDDLYVDGSYVDAEYLSLRLNNVPRVEVSSLGRVQQD